MAKLVKVENKRNFIDRGQVLGTALKLTGLKTDSNGKGLVGHIYYDFLVNKKDETKVGVLPTKNRFKIK